jgi:hypothetical protein
METPAAKHVCTNCGVEIPAGQGVRLATKEKEASKLLCSNCAAALEAAFQAETEDPNLIGAVGLGLVAAVASSLVWYAIVVLSKYQVGFVAIGVGWVVAQGVMFGAGRKRGMVPQVISAVLTLVAMPLSEYFIVRHFYYEGIRVPVLLPLDEMWYLITLGIQEDPITLLFWGIALLTAFTWPRQRQMQRI